MRTYFTSFLIFTSCSAFAQVTLTESLDTIYLAENIWRNNTSKEAIWTQEEKIDTLPFFNVSELLQSRSSLQLRGNGVSSSQTIGYRGAPAAHTKILWNGIPIKQAQLGISDISLMPSFLMSEMALSSRTSSSAWGSGAIAGVLSFNNKARYNSGAQVMAGIEYSTSHNRSLNLGLGVSKERWSLQSKVVSNDHRNQFRFHNDEYDLKAKENHAGLLMNSMLNTLSFKPSNRQEWSLSYWNMYSKRQLQASLQQSFSEAFQIDGFNRLVLSSTSLMRNAKLGLKLAYFNETLDYSDVRSSVFSQSDQNSVILDALLTFSLNAHTKLNLGTTATLNEVNSTVLDSKKTEKNAALFIQLQKEIGIHLLDLSARGESRNLDTLILTPGFALNYSLKLSQKLKAFASINRSFRHPTINDRFYKPGGNERLRTEQSFSQEMGMVFQNQDKEFNTYKLSIFNRVVDHFILWGRDPNQSYFSAQNLNKVWSRGFESSFQRQLDFNRSKLVLRQYATILKSSFQSSNASPRITKGDQLYYTPEILSSTTIGWSFNKFYSRISHFYSSERKGISHNLAAYQLFNASMGYNLNTQNGTIGLNIYCDNIFDTYYEQIELTPNPGRIFRFQITYQFQDLNYSL